MVHFFASVLVAVSALSLVNADAAVVSCGAGQKCPSSLPCCSQYGQCGIGAFCLGGCDPLFSTTLDSCTPEPVCQSKTYTLDSLDSITPNTQYLGDASKADWVSDGHPLAYQNSVLLTMPAQSVGTVLASTSYVWYGKISAKLKTSRGAGVVTAFILLSDVKDEIDFEFVGTELTIAQTNYYSQGVTNYNNGGNISLSDTFANYHTYEIDWTPDQITWSVDGQVGRTKKRSDTWNSTSNRFDYPQTPSRIQLSIWPGGLATNAQGTIDWAGGPIDWNSGDVATAGYFYAAVTEVDVQCYSPPATAGSGNASYIYTNPAGTNDTVSLTNKPTILKSLLGTGTNMSADYPSPVSVSSGSSSTTGSVPAASISEIAVVPGLSGAGPGVDGQRGDSGSSGASSGSSTAASGSGLSSSAAPTGSGGFAQGSSSTAKSTQGSSAPGNNERVFQGSLFAGLIAVIGMLIL